MDELTVNNGVGSQSDFEKSPSEVSPKILKDPSTGRFLPGNGGRKHGALGKSTIARNMILEAAPDLVKRAIALAQNNASMMSTLLEVALPKNRSQLEATAIPGIENCTTLEQKTSTIMDAVTNGVISPDTGLQMISGLDKAESARRLRLLADQINDLQMKIIDGKNLIGHKHG